jgi:hypothetical protein
VITLPTIKVRAPKTNEETELAVNAVFPIAKPGNNLGIRDICGRSIIHGTTGGIEYRNIHLSGEGLILAVLQKLQLYDWEALE